MTYLQIITYAREGIAAQIAEQRAWKEKMLKAQDMYLAQNRQKNIDSLEADLKELDKLEDELEGKLLWRIHTCME